MQAKFIHIVNEELFRARAPCALPITHKWTIVDGGPMWTKVDLSGLRWTENGQSGQEWDKMFI